MQRKEFKRSQFEDHEDWEEQEAEKRTEFHDDENKVAKANTSSSMLQQIQARNKRKLLDNGVGYSKDAEKRTKR